MSTALIEGMLQADAYDHPCARIRLIETHISWIILTGDFAYKIKKPVDFGFLDYSTLDRRHECCRKEIEFNRRLAPELYLDVVDICGEADSPRVNGSGTVIEYAVRMRQFPGGRLLADLAERGELDERTIDDLAVTIADFHEHTSRADESGPFGTVEAIRQPVMENFQQIAGLSSDSSVLERTRRLRDWSATQLAAGRETFHQRKQQGFVRECHGDLHLGNIVALDDRLLPFDCIEFNDNLRCIDVISELAFLFMDIDDHGRRDLAWRLLNRYLERNGDYAGISVLQFYLVYRAVVRAKVAMLRLAQDDLDPTQRSASEASFSNYLELAEQYARPGRPLLLIMHGLSGSGKTYVSQRLLQEIGMLRLRSDIERKRLAGLDQSVDSKSAIGGGIYDAAHSQQTYESLADAAETVIRAGLPVIVDAAFLKHEQRMPFLQLAERLSVRMVIVHCHADSTTLQQRIRQRLQQASDASEADLQVLQHQQEHAEALDHVERSYQVMVNTMDQQSIARLIGELAILTKPD
jgi:aminoglycoside phosphotransferase family enzyme/predicted kinase